MGSRFRFPFVACIVLSLVIGSIVGGKALAAEPLKPRIDRLATPYVDADVVVGMTIGVVQRGETTVVGYGRFGDSDDRRPGGDTIYEIGSTTKAFTGVLLGDAVARGRVRLDQPAQELLPPNVKMPVRGERPITLLDLATHVSGLPRMPDNFKPADAYNPFADYTEEKLYAFVNGHKLARSPGEKSEYSNLAVGLLGHLLARDAGMSYEALLRERIAEPLGMKDTVITLDDDLRGRLAPPHLADGSSNSVSNWDIPTLAGAGAIRSTVNDMLRFIQANLQPPAGELGTALETAWTIHQPPLAAGDFAMGLGWHVARDGQTRWHNGQTGGYHASLFVNRQVDAGVVVLTNTSTMEVDQLAEQIIRMLAGATVEPRKFEKPVEVEVDRELMARYVGKYQLVPGFVLTVSVDGKKLMVGATGQPTFQVYPRNNAEWYYKVVEATLTFKTDTDGKCNEVELFQNGVRQTARRIGEDVQATAQPQAPEKPIEVDRAVMEGYVGRYQLAPNFIMTVRIRNKDQLTVQATGQSPIALLPRSETQWACQGVDATLTFKTDSAGNCNALELFQNGIRQQAKRIE